MTKKVIFTLESKSAMDLMGSDEFPFDFDCFYVTNSHYDFGDLDPAKLPDDLNPMNEETIQEDIRNLGGIMMRTRFNPRAEGPFILKLPDELPQFNRTDLERIVLGWYQSGDLKEKLKQAKI